MTRFSPATTSPPGPGCAAWPSIPAGLLRRLVDEQLKEASWPLTYRKEWTGAQFEAVVGHPDGKVRELLAQAAYVRPEQRARLVEDPAPRVLRALAEGPDCFVAWTWTPQPALPTWAYERLLERNPKLELIMFDYPWLPPDLRARLWPAGYHRRRPTSRHWTGDRPRRRSAATNGRALSPRPIPGCPLTLSPDWPWIRRPRSG